MTSTYTQPSGDAAAENQAAAWLNEAALAEGRARAALVRAAGELLLHGGARALPAALEPLLAHAADRSTDVKKAVVAFIENLSKLHPARLPGAVGALRLLVTCETVAVQKRAIQAASLVYRHTLQWLCDAGAAPAAPADRSLADMQQVWEHLTELKLLVLNMIDSDNEGIRTHSIKFLEEVVLLQTAGDVDELSLASLPPPPALPFLDRRALQQEAEHIFTLLVKFHNSAHISNVNLMACMTSLCGVGRARPRLAGRVARALAHLHAAPPATLSATQLTSVRKYLRLLLLALLRAPRTPPDLLPPLARLLADAGASAADIQRALPRDRRGKRAGGGGGAGAGKRLRLDSPPPDSQGSDDANSRGELDDDAPAPPPAPAASAPAPPAGPADLTEDALLAGLDDADTVVRLVMATLLGGLPADMPAHFATAYAPIPNSGSRAQRRELAAMLLVLVQAAPPAPEPLAEPPAEPLAEPHAEPPVEPAAGAARIPLLRDDDEKATLKNAVAKLQESRLAERRVESAVSRLMEETRQQHLRAGPPAPPAPPPPPTPSVPRLKHKVKLLRLAEITRPIPKEVKERLVADAVRRIVRAEGAGAAGAGAGAARAKLLAMFASAYSAPLREAVLAHVLEAPLAPARLELALGWLYEEYAFMQGFARHPPTLQPRPHEKHDHSYGRLLGALVARLLDEEPGAEAEAAARRVLLEAPLVTEEACELARLAAADPRRAPALLRLLEELCAARPPRAHKYAPSLLAHALSAHEETRALAVRAAARLHARALGPGGAPAPLARLRTCIEKHALLHLGFVALDAPPPELARVRSQPWSDHLYGVCLGLVLALFPQKEELIVDVARVYGCADADAKRYILRAIEPALRRALQPPPPPPGAREEPAPPPLPAAAAALLDECPRGAETLLTRLVHMLTEKAAPSGALVARVRELYATRVPDVRFLVPVLPGLSKSEVLAALPKLIKLNPAVVKEVFAKLLAPAAPAHPPLSPHELLVALHLVEPAQADLKYIIKGTALCFADKQLFTQDVVGGVLQRLAEERAVPVLMLRSVLQALTLYPALAPLVLDILQLLIDKEVWENKVAWEGWVKCCERLVPRSCFLLVALPARALRLAAAASPALLAALRAHAATLAPPERALLPPHVAELAAAAPPAPSAPPALGPSPNPLEPLPPGME